MNQNEIRIDHSGATFGDIPNDEERQKVLKMLESGEYKLDPAFLKRADGTLELVGISIIRSP